MNLYLDKQRKAAPTMATTPSPIHEFDGLDFPLAIGEVYGLRAWKMDSYGRLRALHLTDVPAWRPGINVADCHRAQEPVSWLTGGWLTGGRLTAGWLYDVSLGTISMDPAEPEPAEPKPQEPPPHPVPVEACRCGFYAYTDPAGDETRADAENKRVLGVIRGTGRTLLGTKGFRCEKAEIVALLDPTRGGLKLHRWRREQRRNLRRIYPDVPLMISRRALLASAPIELRLPEPSTDEFWGLR